MEERSWDLRFTWDLNDWELDLVVEFIYILEFDTPSIENGDCVR